MPFALGSYFVNQPTPFVKFTAVNYNNPGEFSFMDPIIIEPDTKPYQGKVIVLVDERTQSSAEYTTMAFRAGRNVTVIGSQTAGADGDASQVVLPGGLWTIISGLGVYYPDGEPTQRIGIIPDIEVKRTRKGVREQRDELLEKAIELIKEYEYKK
ncbi:S41 family peptidase [Myroides fluvii]|uniref:S41 family peptidase n=1 Tax=Myroides fluvii TaxID=2572594 RepID=UPI001E3B1D54|nr:S41 family peptidase [Myroides fluvii]